MLCSKPLNAREQEYCRDCQRHTKAFEQGRSLWLHKAPVSQAVYRFKYENKRYYGKIFAQEMAKQYEAQIRRWKIKEIIPVPLHPSKRRTRGYNQAAILAGELGRLLHIPVNEGILHRIRNTNPQKNLDNLRRAGNLKGAFAVSGRKRARSCVLLVDDIYTTGSTLHQTAKMLKLSGTKKVFFLTISIGQGF